MSNYDKLKVRQNVSKKKAFKELTIIRNTIFWIDVVGEDQNRMPFLLDHLMRKMHFLKN